MTARLVGRRRVAAWEVPREEVRAASLTRQRQQHGTDPATPKARLSQSETSGCCRWPAAMSHPFKTAPARAALLSPRARRRLQARPRLHLPRRAPARAAAVRSAIRRRHVRGGCQSRLRRFRLVPRPDRPVADRAGGDERQHRACVAVADRVVRLVEPREVDGDRDRTPPHRQAALLLDPTTRQPLPCQQDLQDSRRRLTATEASART
jgi:hypothetical protein